MGLVKCFKARETILSQGTAPEYVYLMMKGMCKVYKRSNHIEILQRMLAEAKEKAEHHDLKYAYHHKLRNTLNKAKASSKSSNGNAPGSSSGSSSNHHARLNKDTLKSFYGFSNITESEELRYEMELEIQKLASQIQKAMGSAASAAAQGDDEHSSCNPTNTVQNEAFKAVEVKTLKWPMLFGEACILEPESGTSRGTVVADTACEIFIIHKTQLQTFLVGENLLESTRLRAVQYPEDVVLEKRALFQRDWMEYRGLMMDTIPKARWPPPTSLAQPFHAY